MKTILKSVTAALLFTLLAFIALKPEASAQIKVISAPTAVFQDYKAINLPEDGSKYFTTVFLPDNFRESAQCRDILAWFQTDPRLVGLTQKTHYAIYMESDHLYQTRYKAAVGKVPCVCVNDASGKTLFITREFPKNGTALADMISESSNSTQGWRRDQRRQGVWNPDHKHGCPFPRPVTPPVAPVVPEPIVQPEVIADTTPAKKGPPIVLLVLAGVVGAGLSLASDMKKEANKE